MKHPTLTQAGALVYAWMQVVVFGGLLSETVLLYPNVFRDVPASLEVTLDFLEVTDPGAFFPPIGTGTILVGLTALALVWKHRKARFWFAASLSVFILGNAVFSVLFSWPRNVILFEEGEAVHSTEYLEQVAQEFVVGHGVRLAASALAAVLATAGFLINHRSAVGPGRARTRGRQLRAGAPTDTTSR